MIEAKDLAQTTRIYVIHRIIDTTGIIVTMNLYRRPPMNDVEYRLRQSIRNKLRLLIGVGAASFLLLAAGVLRADPPPFDPMPAASKTATARQREPIWVSPISPYDPAEGTAGAHAVQIDAGAARGYVQTSAYAQTASTEPYDPADPSRVPLRRPEQLPPGGYLWGGSPRRRVRLEVIHRPVIRSPDRFRRPNPSRVRRRPEIWWAHWGLE